MEWKGQNGWKMSPSLSQPLAHTQRARETSPMQDSLSQNNKFLKSRKKQSVPPCHAVIGSRPYCSPEYSPHFHKLGSTLPCSTYRGKSQKKVDNFIPLQPSTKARVPHLEIKKLLDKQAGIEEVKQLDEWKPAEGFTTR